MQSTVSAQPSSLAAAAVSVAIAIFSVVTGFLTSQSPLADEHGIPIAILATICILSLAGVVAGAFGGRVPRTFASVTLSVLGIVTNLAIGTLAGIFLMLSGLPGP